MQTILQRLARFVNTGHGSRQRRKQLFQRAMRRRFAWRLQQLEQLEERVLLSSDFGDAPTAEQSGFANSYPTTLSHNGASHTATGPMLGASRGVESDGQPTAGANGDDRDGDDDEDGVTFVPGFLTPGDATVTVEVDMTATAGTSRLSAWIDFNADGDWSDSGERVFTNTTLTGEVVNSLTLAVPAAAKLGPTYARFRVSTMGGLSYDGATLDGEVEDYRVSIAIPPNTHSLFPGEQFPAGTSPSSVAAADLNGDGYLDLITSNRLSHNVSVLMGIGDGTYAPQEKYAVGRQPDGVAVDDLNGDGRIDIVTVNWIDDEVSVLLNRGDGTFAAQVTYDVGEAPGALALADLNGDNKVDIVAANGTDRNVSVLLGRGNGTFAPQVTYALGPQPYGPRPMSVALADVNGDTYVDIVTANDITDDVSILFNRGNGTFLPYTTYAIGLDPNSVALADVNGDNAVDIVASCYLDGKVWVLLNSGDGTFGEPVTYYVGSGPHSVALSDINQDGHTDILAGYASKQVAVLLGLGDGTFASQVSYLSGNQPVCLLPVDVNGDGHVDIVAANDGDHTASVLLGYGDGTFPLPVTDRVGNHPSSLALADLNRDKLGDIVAVNNNAHNVSVLLGVGGGSFAPQVTYPVGTNPKTVALDDLNGDNYPDIVTTNPVSNNISVLLGVGDGTFAAQVMYYATDKPLSVALADLNGDSYVDIVTSNVLYDVSVFLGLGDGTFSDAVSYPVGYGPYWVALSDLSGDGRVDIVTANTSDDTVSVLLGLGDGTFDTHVTYAVRDQPYCVALVDLDGDTHMDIVTANLGNDNVSVLMGIGDGTFATQATHAVGSYPQSVVSDDLNGDGHADLIVANYGSDNISVLLGIGDGTFAPQAIYAAGSDPYAVAAGDLDADVQKDLVTVNESGNDVMVLLNQRGPKDLDCGDAPDPTYPTFLASDGARHTATGPTLGSNRDTESNGQPITDADSDDTTGTTDDEDGVTLPALSASTVNTTTANVTVDLQHAGPSSNRLDAWIDFNQDGDWDDDGERIFTSYDLGTTNGAQSLTFTVPQDTGGSIVYGTTYARFRLSTVGGLLPTGLADDGEVEDYQLTIHSHVVGRHVFYNRSAWDGNDAAANAADDNAIASDKVALLPGGTATLANYTSYDKGINGLMIDMPHMSGTPTVDDFLFRVGNSDTPYGADPHSPADDWPWAPAPTSITVRPGAGLDGADRVTLTWADGAIRNHWLQVTLLATDNTGLAANDVFYVGNAAGESGNALGDALVNATDEIGARNNPHGPFTPATKDDAYDYNRDKLVNATDQILARNNRTNPFTALKLITPPLEDDGSGEGEGERSGDVWTSWTDRSLFDTLAPLNDSTPQAAAVPSITSSDLLRVVRWTSGMSPVTTTSLLERADLFLPLMSVSPEVRRMGDRLTRQSDPQGLASTMAWSQSAITARCPVGPVKDEQSHSLSRPIHWAADSHGRNPQRTLDEALQELLAEWKQF